MAESYPEKAHPLVRALFSEMMVQGVTQQQMSQRSGVNKNTFKDWRTRGNPRIADLEACFNVLGKTIAVQSLIPDQSVESFRKLAWEYAVIAALERRRADDLGRRLEATRTELYDLRTRKRDRQTGLFVKREGEARETTTSDDQSQGEWRSGPESGDAARRVHSAEGDPERDPRSGCTGEDSGGTTL